MGVPFSLFVILVESYRLPIFHIVVRICQITIEQTDQSSSENIYIYICAICLIFIRWK